MSSRAQELFQKLQNADSIRALIGQSEDIHFDCKEWPASDGDAQRVFAKGACGLTNADGGVIVVGMSARSTCKDEPDLVESLAPVADTSAVKSRILDLVGQLVEPGIEGVQAAEVNDPPNSKSGFVVVHIPPSTGAPRRSRKDWKFYLRIGSGTFPMEYFQIEERFGKRPPPKLELYLEVAKVGPHTYSRNQPVRYFVLGLKNVGTGVAKFPSIRYCPTGSLGLDMFGIDGNQNHGLPLRPSEPEWVVFRGGVDDVIYPSEVRKVTKLMQAGSNDAPDGHPYPLTVSPRGNHTRWDFKAASFRCEISCEGTPTLTVEHSIPEFFTSWPQ
jgi:hypothetical protein